MKAVVVEQTGGPEQLSVVERPTPEPGAGTVVVDVAAAGVNFFDIYQRQGSIRDRCPMSPAPRAQAGSAPSARAPTSRSGTGWRGR
jgi:NADPH:quinone reductase-like Zn-dependent oxidoreductase